jgi:hydroxymethylbilane synthase
MSIFHRKIVVATRLSELAQAQSKLACHWIAQQYDSFEWDLLGLSTQGDLRLDVNLKHLGGKGVFVKELQQALLSGQADLAVHSMKDLPIEQHRDLMIPGYCISKGTPLDILVSQYPSWESLPSGSVIGTSSLRRGTQFLKLRPDCKIRPVRGNIMTRLRRFESGDFDGLILAEAGMIRVGLDIPYDVFRVEEMVPAFNQGILGIECTKKNIECINILHSITDSALQLRVQWEREISSLLNASCKSAIGVYVDIQSTDPLVAEVHVFVCRNWEAMRTGRALFNSLLSAKQWVVDVFDLKNQSWDICQIEFT